MAYFSWLWESWWRIVPAPWVSMLLSLVAVFCGVILGADRQRREKPAGLRTLTLVCLGSSVFTMMSFVFTTTTGDSGRVAAQIVTGIGFLGAGVILHGRHVISGMTTAALIWMTAAIGMVVGAGYPVAGLALSILVDRMLVGIFIYETRGHPDLKNIHATVDFALNKGLTRVRLGRILANYNHAGVKVEWSEPTPETGQLVLHLNLARIHLYELLAELAEVPEVISIRQVPVPH